MFFTPIINGFIEGCNNKIKVLNKNSYDHRNFKRFRNRILHMFYSKHINSTIKQATV
ncbi:transposase [Pseudoruminococcus massiliensis]|uniref:transposase n=1 Tax=Pseudoruminococcus massiliensis TaxID=2086583 RepID=UPI0040294767